MTERLDADVVIAGAGAAGLSLAVRLAARAPRLRVHLVEPRVGVTSDRTFAFFKGEAHPFESAISAEYARIVVRDRLRTVARTLRAHPYQVLPGGAFQSLARDLIHRADRVALDEGVRVERVVESEEGVHVTTSRGELRARLFVDARGGLGLEHARPIVGGPGVSASEASESFAHSITRSLAGSLETLRGAPVDDVAWLQHFVGLEVRTEPLMDFDVAPAAGDDVEPAAVRGPHFVYVLPRSPHEALVEDTYFSPSRLPSAAYERTLDAWLARRGAGAFEVLRREAGAIPMRTAPHVEAGRSRVVVAGQRGGAAKASTGYAFVFIQKQTALLADAIASTDARAPLPWITPHSPVATFFDRVFLAYLASAPDEAARTFVGLFDRTPVDALARFLSERGTALDHLAVINAVPRLPVLATAVRARSLWLRSR